MKNWTAERSLGNRMMVLEDDGTDDGRLVADKLLPADAVKVAAVPELVERLHALALMAADFPTELNKEHPDVVKAFALLEKLGP